MSQIKLAIYAILLELGAWAQMFETGRQSDLAFLGFMLTHSAASAVLASLALLMVPSDFARPRVAVWMLFFALSACIPVLGFVGIVAGLFALPLMPALRARRRFSKVALPALDPHERRDATAFRQAGLRQFLNNDRAPVDQRLKALVALQNAPAQFSSPVLRDLLGDSSEDLRLLAYGMLETREKKLNAQIQTARAEYLAATDDAAIRRRAAQQLSTLYWELVYQGLVQGDLRRHAAGEALRYLEEALSEEADAGLHLRHGHLLHELKRNDEAAAAYRRAAELGIPPPRVVPYLAELAFERHDYREVIRLLGGLREFRSVARLEPLLRFWGAA